MKKFMTTLLMVSALIFITACGGSGDNTASTTAPIDITITEETETTAADPFAGLPEQDFNGFKFRTITRNFEMWIKDYYIPEETGEVVDDAIFHRNQKIQERYNIELTHSVSSSSNSDQDAKASILAGDDAYDIVVNHPHVCAQYANGMLLVEYSNLTYVDLDNPWWNQDARNNLSINHKQYVMYGDLSYQTLGAADVMLFNKLMFNNYGIDFPYDMALDGTWTFDVFENIIKVGAADINGDGVMDNINDQFGYATQKWIGPIQVLYAAGQRVISKDEDDIPYISLNTPRTQEVFERYFIGIIDSEYAYCQMDGTSRQGGGYLDMFSNNRALCIDVNLNDVSLLREMDTDFGIVPWPKYDESTDFCANVDAGTNTYVVPVTNIRYDLTSIVLESLGAFGYYEVVPIYYGTALQTKYSRDEESAGMLDLIKDARVFDLGYFNSQFGGAFSTAFATIANNKIRDFNSWYTSNEASVKAGIEKYLAAYME